MSDAPERPPVNKDDIAELRRMFFAKHNPDNGCGDFDDRDIDRVRADDHYLHGYMLICKMDKEDALTKLIAALKWRKEYGINDFTLESFPEWALSLGGVYPHGRDNQGRKILWFKVALHKKDASKSDVAKKYIAFWLDKLQKENPGENILILEDMTNAGLANMDMDVIGFKINCFETKFPALVGMMYVYSMPWYLNAIWKVIEKLLSAESKAHIKFLFGAEMQQYISKDTLPPHMGGTDTYQWTWPPPDNEDSLEEISMLQNSMDETFEQASEDLGTSPSMTSDIPSSDAADSGTSAPDSGRSTPEPGAIGNGVDVDRVSTEVGNGDVKQSQKVKKVTFAPDTEDNEDRDHSMLAPSSSSITRLKKKSAKKSKVKDVARGPLLTIRPGDQLIFNPPPTASSSSNSRTKLEPSTVLSLTNTTDKKVAYKVKTTTPDRYRVRPSAGPINPGASINITITLLSGTPDEVLKDKFLILSTNLEEVIRTPAELSDYWRRVLRENIIEHRMRCQYNIPSAQEMEFKWIREHMLAMNTKLETIQDHSTILEKRTHRLQLILRLQLLLIFILTLVCAMWTMGWIDINGIDNENNFCLTEGRQVDNDELNEKVYTKVFNTPV